MDQGGLRRARAEDGTAAAQGPVSAAAKARQLAAPPKARPIAKTEPAPRPRISTRDRLGDLLLRHGALTREDIAAALALHRTGDLALGDAICALDTGRGAQVLSAWRELWGAEAVDLCLDPPDPALIDRLGALTCLAARAAPWRRIGGATVVATEDPAAFETLRPRYERALGPVMMALARPGAVGQAVARTHRERLRDRAEARVPPPVACRSWRAWPFRSGVAAALGVSVAGALWAPVLLCTALLWVAVISLAGITALKLAAAIAQARPDATGPQPCDPDLTHLPVISVLVPLYREERIAAHLVQRVSQLDYPHGLLDLCLVVEEDDMTTRTTLARTALPPWMRVISVPRGNVKTKPRAMNYALDFCRGSIIGIYDAEDAPAADQLRRVAARFAQVGPEVACLQGCLDFYNTRHNWLARCFTLEYASWFRVMLPGIARLGLVVPLGGTTLFFRRRVLENLGAWDAHNVTEDADLGVRLVRAGYRTEVLDITTGEEANCVAVPWVKQRSRWLKGYAMTYAVHMRAPRSLWRDLGAWRFFGVQALFLGTVLQFALAPLLWSMWVLPFGLPHPVTTLTGPGSMAAIIGVFVCSEAVSLGIAVRAAARTGRWWLVPWAITLPVYFTLATAAMYKAFAEMLHRPFYWDKTQHGKLGGT